MTSAVVGQAHMQASHWMQSWKRRTRLLFSTRSRTLVGQTATHASQPVQRSSLMLWTRMRTAAAPTTGAGRRARRALAIETRAMTAMARPPRIAGTTRVTGRYLKQSQCRDCSTLIQTVMSLWDRAGGARRPQERG